MSLQSDSRAVISGIGALASLPFCAISTVPRPTGRNRDGLLDDFLEQRKAALIASFFAQEDGAVAVAWVRLEATAAASVFVGGSQLIGRADSDAINTSVLLPPGATGQSADGSTVCGLLEEVPCWTRIEVAEALRLSSRDGAPEGQETLARSLEDALGSVWPHSYALLVHAHPLPPADIANEARRVQRELQGMGRQSGAEHEVEKERAEARYRQLRRAALIGLWRMTFLVGASDERRSRQLAALVAAMVDVRDLPYVLTPTSTTRSLAAALSKVSDEPAPADGLVPWATTDLLAAIARPPIREIPGIRMVTGPAFDVTPEKHGDIRLGTVLDAHLTEVGEMTLERRALNDHTFVCGATGSGKSQTIRHLLEQISTAPEEPLPWLVIEPAKAEYRRMSGRLAGRATVLAVRPGTPPSPEPGKDAPDSVAAGLNPLEPEPGFSLQTHVDLTRALFLASFQPQEPFPQVLSAALTRCYEELGWDLALGESRTKGVTPPYPNLGDLQRVALDVVRDIGYGDEVTRDVRGYVDVRLSSLRHGSPGRFFEGGHPIEVGQLLRQNVVFEIEDLGDDRDKAFLMGTVIVRLVEHLRVREHFRQRARDDPGPPRLRHVTVIEEAHRLLRRPEALEPAAHAVELFASLLAEVRAYGEGIVVAEQIPSKLIPDVIKNTSVKVMHRLPALDDRHAVGATMNLTDVQSEYVVAMPRGAAAVFTEEMDHPALVRIPYGEKRESDEGLRDDPPLARRFSAACGPLCLNRACTLREMRRAQRQLEDDPRVVVWVELAVLAHILGFPSPEPSRELHASMTTLERRDIECAIAHAVDTAVHVRSGELSRHYSPAQLAAHVSELLLSQLDATTSPCGPDEWRWQAGPFRWNHLRAALQRRSQEQAAKGRHPDSRMWRERYGVEVPGETIDEQLAAINGWVVALKKRRRRLLFGGEQPSPLEEAVGDIHTSKGWQKTLTAKLAASVTIEAPWPDAYLVPTEPTDDDR